MTEDPNNIDRLIHEELARRIRSGNPYPHTEKKLERMNAGFIESEQLFAPVVEKLRLLGMYGTQLYGIVGRHAPLNDEAVQVLWDALDVEQTDTPFIVGIVRALGQSAAPLDPTKLEMVYKRSNNASLRWDVLAALAQTRSKPSDAFMDYLRSNEPGYSNWKKLMS